MISSRQEAEIKPELKLSSYIGRDELWSNVKDYDILLKEIFDICKEGIKVGNSYRLYEILGGDKILNMELGLSPEVQGNIQKNPTEEGEEEEGERSDDEL